MQLETLIGSPLTGIEVYEPWAKALTTQPALHLELAGAFVLTFGSGPAATSLVCTSPLRHLRCPKGTIFGLASGDADWPHALRKALQSHQTPEAFYRQTMRRALMARFRQRPLHLQRLRALRYPVQVKDVPDGLIEEIAQTLRNQS